MLPECPEDLKHLLPYLQRASELKNREPVIAYYCTAGFFVCMCVTLQGGFYAANIALTKGFPKTKENEAYILALLNELEAEKKELLEEPAIKDPEQARAYILQFAMKIFLAADNEDRSGQASKKTGRLFLVSSQFLEVSRALGDLPEEIEERIKYAKWKAADIIRALNEGRQPHPGPPGASTLPNEPAQDSSSRISDDSNLPSFSGHFSPTIHAQSTLSPPQQPVRPTERISSPPVVLPSINTRPGPAPSAPSSAGTAATTATLANAERLARFSLSAIQFEDVPTAIKNMEQCLALLYELQDQLQ